MNSFWSIQSHSVQSTPPQSYQLQNNTKTVEIYTTLFELKNTKNEAQK